MSHVKTSKGLLAISSRSAVAASADAPPKGVIVEADSLETNTGDVALLIGGLIQPGDEAIKDSSSTSPRRPGIRGYSFGREEGRCWDRGNSCSSNSQCGCSGTCCVASTGSVFATTSEGYGDPNTCEYASWDTTTCMQD